MEIRNTLILDGEEPLSKAMNEMLRTNLPVIVMKNREYCGIIDDRTISRGVTDASKVKCGNACVNAPTVYSSSALLERLNSFLSGHFKALPVFDEKNKPLGVTTRVDLLKDFLNSGMFPRVAVSEMMAKPVYTINYDATLGETSAFMKSHNCHRLVVVRNGYPVGVVSTFDFSAMLTKPKGRRGQRMIKEVKNPDSTKHVSDIIRESLVTIEENEPLEHALRKMVEKQVSTILVTSNKKPAGTFSAFDLFKKLLEMSKEKEEGITISGLGEEEMLHYNEVRDTVKKVIDKFSKSLEIRSVSVHFKKGKSVYKGNLYLELKKEHLALSAEDFDLKTTLNTLAAELYTVLNKRKSILKQRKGKWRVEK